MPAESSFETVGGEAVLYEAKSGGSQNQGSKLPPELQEYVPQVEQFITDYREVFYAIARDRSLRFVAGPDYFIDLKAGEINVGVNDWKWAKENGLTTWQEVWSVGHEISHFDDLRQNPEGMLSHFEYMQKRAKELAPQALTILEQKFEGQVPEHFTKQVPVDKEGRTMSGMEYFIYEKLHRDLYNVLDDVYVNNTLALRSAVFAQGGSQEGEVARLYRDYLFPTDPNKLGTPPRELEAVDYTSQAQCLQFSNFLLRHHMVPEQTVLIAAEVSTKLQGFADTVAEKFGLTLEKEVESITNPANPKSRDPGWRYKRFREAIEPVFVELMMRDLQNLEPPPPSETQPKQQNGQGSGQGSGQESGEKNETQSKQSKGNEVKDVAKDEQKPEKENGDQSGKGKEGKPEGAPKLEQPSVSSQEQGGQESPNPWQGNNPKPSPITLESVKNFIQAQAEKAKEQKEAKEAEEKNQRLTPQEKAAQAQAKSDAEVCKKYDISPQYAAEYRELEASVEEHQRQLAEVFEQFMSTISQKVSLFWTEGFRSGRFNVDSFIEKYGPTVATGKLETIPWDKLEVFDQKEFESRLVLFPDHIRVRLILDGSGSMEKDRILAVKQLSVLFLNSLSTLESTVNLRFRLKDPFVVDTEIVMYGDPGRSLIIKEFAEGKVSREQELADRFRALSEINNGYGSTCDAEPFWAASKTIDDKRAEELRTGKSKEFVFEITDGGANKTSAEAKGGDSPAQDTRNAIDALESKGVVARGFQIGAPSDKEKTVFNEIWGEDGSYTPDPADVTPTVAKTMAEEIRKTQVQIQYYGEEEET